MKLRIGIAMEQDLFDAAHKLMDIECFSGFSGYVEHLVRQQAIRRRLIGRTSPEPNRRGPGRPPKRAAA